MPSDALDPDAAASLVPATLHPPVDVALAAAAPTLPGSRAMPGGARYQPKFDGFRLVAVRDAGQVSLWTRQGKDLTVRFPDVAAAVDAQVPAGWVLDGEVVVWSADRTSFTDLSRRLAGSPAHVARLVRASPASYVAFDVLAAAGQDLRREPFDARRDVLEVAGARWVPPLAVCPQTTDPVLAQAWFEDMAVAGIEGLVVKGGAQRYRPGRRDWVKVKRRDELAVVCAAVLGSVERPTVVVAGLPVGDRLRIVGRTVPLPATAARQVAAALRAPRAAHPWPAQVTSATINGFGRDREPVRLVRVAPFVVEVSADAAWSGTSFRHPLRFVRVRPDLEPDDVTAPSTLGR